MCGGSGSGGGVPGVGAGIEKVQRPTCPFRRWLFVPCHRSRVDPPFSLPSPSTPCSNHPRELLVSLRGPSRRLLRGLRTPSNPPAQGLQVQEPSSDLVPTREAVVHHLPLRSRRTVAGSSNRLRLAIENGSLRGPGSGGNGRHLRVLQPSRSTSRNTRRPATVARKPQAPIERMRSSATRERPASQAPTTRRAVPSCGGRESTVDPHPDGSRVRSSGIRMAARGLSSSEIQTRAWFQLGVSWLTTSLHSPRRVSAHFFRARKARRERRLSAASRAVTSKNLC